MAGNVKFCTTCGNELNVKAEICPKCGVRQPSSDGGAGGKRVTAAILALLIGGLGIHHFYLGNTLRGVLYIIFCWTFIPALIGLIEGIIYLTMSDADFSAKYC